MDYLKISSALKSYRQIGAHEAVSGVSPHRLIQLLLQGALQYVASSKGYMLRNDNQKGVLIGRAISILEALRQSLNFSAGGEIAENLNKIYEYCQLRLLRANVDNDPNLLDEVINLLRGIKSGWDAIEPAEADDDRAVPRVIMG